MCRAPSTYELVYCCSLHQHASTRSLMRKSYVSAPPSIAAQAAVQCCYYYCYCRPVGERSASCVSLSLRLNPIYPSSRSAGMTSRCTGIIPSASGGVVVSRAYPSLPHGLRALFMFDTSNTSTTQIVRPVAQYKRQQLVAANG